MINIKELNKEKQTLSFITDMPISLANAIRRSLLEISTLAIDEIEIVKNDSALYDEIIAHRLGLVPIKTDKASKEVKFKLQGAGPKIVTAADLSPSVGTPYELPITILNDGHEIEIIAEAKLGKGVDHIKHSPGLAFFSNNLDSEVLDFVTINEDGSVSYDEDELKRKKVSDKVIKEIKKLKNVNEIVFTIESWGQLEVKDIFPKAVEALEENLDEMKKAIK